MKSNARQVGGTHYKKMAVEPWDYIYAHGLDFFEGNIVKYITRFHHVGNINDLLKVQHYSEKLLELKNGNTGRKSKRKNS